MTKHEFLFLFFFRQHIDHDTSLSQVLRNKNYLTARHRKFSSQLSVQNRSQRLLSEVTIRYKFAKVEKKAIMKRKA